MAGGRRGPGGQASSVSASRRGTGVAEARPSLEGQTYLMAATTMSPARDPLGAAYVVFALPQNALAAAAASELLPRLLLAGGAALLLAMLLVVLVSLSLPPPLAKLAAAAEEIAPRHHSPRAGDPPP